jgi:hypothetical protein
LKTRFLKEKDIADIAWQSLQEWSNGNQEAIKLPIDIDRFINEHLKIPILYALIEHRPDGIPLARTNHPSIDEPCRITVNEGLLGSFFAMTPGLERTTLAHEAGHCVLHVDHSRSAQLELLLETPNVPNSHFISTNVTEPDSYDAFRAKFTDEDQWWREWQAHAFMRHILMPKSLLLPELVLRPTLNWPALFDLRDQFDVTISAIIFHLRTLKYIWVADQGVIDLRRNANNLPLY